VILDIGLTIDMSGFEGYSKLEGLKAITFSIVVYTGKELSKEEMIA
jgi:hypothetical protein